MLSMLSEFENIEKDFIKIADENIRSKELG